MIRSDLTNFTHLPHGQVNGGAAEWFSAREYSWIPVKKTFWGNIPRRLTFSLLAVFFSVFVNTRTLTAHTEINCAENKKLFASEVSRAIGEVWEIWQDGLEVENVMVDGGYGKITPGCLRGPVFSSPEVIGRAGLDGVPDRYKVCVRVVLGAVADAMRVWQRGYYHNSLPFPEGSSSVFSLTPCNNVPVVVHTGLSTGESAVKEDVLYNHMLLRSPIVEVDEDISFLFLAAARAFVAVFNDWQRHCFIEGIVASGGVAPAPAPMGTGPGPVRGARGGGGRFSGAYFNGRQMYAIMLKIFEDIPVD